VLIEHPVRRRLAAGRPEGTRVETTGEHYRVSAELEPRRRRVDVVEERPITGATSCWTLGDDQLRYLFQARDVPARLREALAEIAAQRAAIGERQRDLQRLEGEVAAIMEDQARLRQNLHAVPRGSDLHRRYLARMDEQETRLADLRDQVDEAQTALEAARDAHRDFVRGLDL
jgi:septal ring factor EnvC (AmiA/AmiB activator)